MSEVMPLTDVFPQIQLQLNTLSGVPLSSISFLWTLPQRLHGISSQIGQFLYCTVCCCFSSGNPVTFHTLFFDSVIRPGNLTLSLSLSLSPPQPNFWAVRFSVNGCGLRSGSIKRCLRQQSWKDVFWETKIVLHNTRTSLEEYSSKNGKETWQAPPVRGSGSPKELLDRFLVNNLIANKGRSC